MNKDSKETPIDLSKIYELAIDNTKKNHPEIVATVIGTAIGAEPLIKYIENEIEQLNQADKVAKNMDATLHAICMGRIGEAETILDWVKQQIRRV